MDNSTTPGTILPRVFRLIVPIILATALASCGFSLRSSDVISTNFPALYLNLQQPSSEFAVSLRSALSGSNVTLLESSEATGLASVPVLNVGAERLNRIPVTVTPTAGAAQYEIQLSVTVSLLGDGAILLQEEDLTLRRIYFEDTSNISGNLEEVELIEAEMRRELVNRLLRRLETIDPPSVSNPAT